MDTKILAILPFDHRSSFTKNMLGIHDRPPTDAEIEKIKEEKEIIYVAFKKAVSEGVPKDEAAILVDEEFGSQILQNAKNEGYRTILTTEKSGQSEFDFEYGEEEFNHIRKYNPDYAKALIRYNPEGDKILNQKQAEKLKSLTDFCHQNGFKFLLEPLVIPTEEEIKNSSQEEFDKNLRPSLTLRMMEELQNRGVEPDIWKIEGMELRQDYEKAVQQAQINGRENVGIVVLGRVEEEAHVIHWLKTGAPVPGVVGFAVGRTVFWDPLVYYTSGQIEKEEAIERININYQKFYNIFINARGQK